MALRYSHTKGDIFDMTCSEMLLNLPTKAFCVAACSAAVRVQSSLAGILAGGLTTLFTHKNGN